jgi:branched-chain amino acid transport system permease protein
MTLGGTYALVSLGLVLVYRSTGIFSFSHGQVMLLSAATVGLWQLNHTAPFPVAVVVGLGVSAGVYVLFFRVVLERMTGLPHLMGFVATFGLAAVLDGVAGIVFGSQQLSIRVPAVPTGTVTLLSTRISSQSLWWSAFTILLALSIAAVLRYTPTGIRLRAAGQDPLLASQGGINVRRLQMLAWGVAGALAGIAGIAYGSVTLVDQSSMTHLALAAFPAILLGGLDSVEGAVVGGIAIGVLQGFTATYLGGQYQDVVAYSVLLLVLLVFPTGLFGSVRVQKI